MQTPVAGDTVSHRINLPNRCYKMTTFLETYITPDDYLSPDWNNCGKVHEWKHYVSEEVQGLWDTFSDEVKAALARQSEAMASKEEWD